MKNYTQLLKERYGINNDYSFLMHLINHEYGYFALKIKINKKYQRKEMIEEILNILLKMKYNLIYSNKKNLPTLETIYVGDPRDRETTGLALIDELYQKWLDEKDT